MGLMVKMEITLQVETQEPTPAVVVEVALIITQTIKEEMVVPVL